MLISDLRDLNQLRDLSSQQIENLAADIRSTLVHTVSKTGGHLGPNLGVVELTIALHRVFDSPRDRIVFDTGHQTYVHKLLTARSLEFSSLRQMDGLSGYPSRSESQHDIVENSHATTALSWVDGIADGLRLTGDASHVVGVIGDGALTGGMAWEALNNIAGKPKRPVIIVLNDNGRSYAPTIGGLADELARLRASDASRNSDGMRSNLFENIGLSYIGPIDGHDVEALEAALTIAKNSLSPVVVHCVTQKGRGFIHAENDVADHFHGIGPIDANTGLPTKAVAPTWTSAFSDSLIKIAHERKDIVAMTAAMVGPTGLAEFSQQFPDRFFDVGIAEQHGTTSAAGMAIAGLHPVVALYATFINRAFDQVLMDCALHKAGVTFVLDRAGVTGDDGASHNGIWDLALLSIVPGIQIFAPRDAEQLEIALRAAVDVKDGPTVIRFPKGNLPPEIPAVRHINNLDVLVDNDVCEVFLVGVGALSGLSIEVANKLNAQGVKTRVVNSTSIFPIPAELISQASKAKLAVTIEDGLVTGGIGDALSSALRQQNSFVPVKSFGVREGFPRHAPRATILKESGLEVEALFNEITYSLGSVAEL